MSQIITSFNIKNNLISVNTFQTNINCRTLNITSSLYNAQITGYDNDICIVDITTYEYTDGSIAPNPEIAILIYTSTYVLVGILKLFDFTVNMLTNGVHEITIYQETELKLSIKNIQVIVIQNNQITININVEEEYDYVIIGFGTAASVIAYNLGRDSNVKTLVLEKGNNELNNPNVLFPFGFGALQNNRTITDIGLSQPNNVSGYGRQSQYIIGSTWGGSSTVNYMVYDRGSPQMWNKLGKYNCVFNYNNILDNFWKKVENYTGQPITTPELHGHNGNYYQNVGKNNALTNYYATAYKNVLNIDFYSDDNAYQEVGTFPCTYQNKVDFNVPNPVAFTRSTFAIGYTQNIVNSDGSKLKDYGLTIKSNCVVDKFDIDKYSYKIIGIYYLENNIYKYVKVRKLAILSAGALNSPSILQRSGIGKSDDLKSIGIDVIINNNNVGYNIKNQYGVSTIIKVDKQIADEMPLNKYNFFGFPGVSYFPYVNNGIEGDFKRQCYNFILNAVIALDPSETGLSQTLYDHNTESLMVYQFWTLSPYSLGTVKIDSKNPEILFNYSYDTYSDPRDLDIGIYMLDIMNECIADMNKQAGKKIISVAYPDNYTSYMKDRASKEIFLKSLAYGAYHPFGSCQIGDNSNNGVVNSNLHVFGLKNLMICDASILINDTIGAGPGGQLFALGHGASEIIKNMYGDGVICYHD